MSPASPFNDYSGDLSIVNGEGGLVKKDLVVRFTEQQNSIQHVTSSTTTSGSRSVCQSIAEKTEPLLAQHLQQTQESIRCSDAHSDATSTNEALSVEGNQKKTISGLQFFLF